MRPYSKHDVEQIYHDLISDANKCYEKQMINDALKDIIAAAQWAYNFNFMYSDSQVEDLLRKIGDDIVKPITITQGHPNRCVLIDSFLWDNRGLSQQYLRAMMYNDMEIMVVHTNRGGAIGKDISRELKNYGKAIIVRFIENTSLLVQTEKIVKAITEFSPNHIFLHLTPWDVVALMSLHVITGAKIYNINLTDHAYWMGVSFIDINLEFRPYGMTVSSEKRGLLAEQIVNLPYYPITKKVSVFDGFPYMPADSIKILTGGSLYKMMGKNDVFFRIMEKILNISPKVYILVAGFNNNKQFDDKLQNIKGKDRILQIGVRKDIDAVFQHSDIYLSTYPMMGGLMSQYAAIHAKPIIAYHDKGDVMNMVEEVVNYYQQEFRSFTDLDAMGSYAKKIIDNPAFRQEQGKILQNGMMSEMLFNKEFSKIITNGSSSFKWKKDEIDYNGFFNRYLDLENNEGYGATKMLVSNQGLPALWKLKNKRGNVMEVLLLSWRENLCYGLKRITYKFYAIFVNKKRAWHIK